MGRKKKYYPYKNFVLKSKSELEVAKQCDKDNLNWSYETVVVPWVPPPIKEKLYRPDFIIEKKDGTILLVEYKEYLDIISKRILRHVTKQHPELDIRVLFGKNCSKKKIRKGSKTTYGQWCDKFKIPWKETKDKSIPKGWLL